MKFIVTLQLPDSTIGFEWTTEANDIQQADKKAKEQFPHYEVLNVREE